MEEEYVVMFPFMAKGHLIPFLALALEIEKRRGYKTILINTPLNIKWLRSSVPPASSIRLLEIPFCSTDHGLPPDTENTTDLPYHLIINLCQACNSFKPVFKKLFHELVKEHGKPPLCLISDIFFGWCSGIVHEFGVFHALFSTSSAYGLACYFSICLNEPHLESNSDEFTLPDFPNASSIHVSQLSDTLRSANGADAFSTFVKEVIPESLNADGLLINTMEELEKVGLGYFREFTEMHVWSVGPLLLPPTIQFPAETDLCRNWLDEKPANSVLYVSFGTQNTLSAFQMMQLAMALESSGKNFIWVVRPPIGYDINNEFNVDEFLPKGFARRVVHDQNRGLIFKKWAPQMEILSHKSTSAFMSHCGWNSLLESLINGVPILGWGMASEQCYNVKFLVEKIGVCVEVARGKTSEVKHEQIASKIEIVMSDSEKGRELRRKACEVGEMMKNAKKEEGIKGSSVVQMDELFSASTLMRGKVQTS